MVNAILVDGVILISCIAVLFVCVYLFIEVRQLKSVNENLNLALRSTHKQGQWGELHLRRTLEMAGMSQYCDFETQVTLPSMAGDQRPDVIIHLHNERFIIIDAKSPIGSHLDIASASTDSERIKRSRNYINLIRRHISDLSRKEYWQHFQPAPAFVVLYIPNEAMFRAALEGDSTLFDVGTKQNIILTSPITLVALLKTIEYGWRQENRAQSVQQIVNHSQSLNEEMQKLIDQWKAFSKPLSTTVLEYNKLAGIYSDKVLPILKQIRALDGTFENSDRALQVNTIQIMPKEMQLEGDTRLVED